MEATAASREPRAVDEEELLLSREELAHLDLDLKLYREMEVGDAVETLRILLAEIEEQRVKAAVASVVDGTDGGGGGGGGAVDEEEVRLCAALVEQKDAYRNQAAELKLPVQVLCSTEDKVLPSTEEGHRLVRALLEARCLAGLESYTTSTASVASSQGVGDEGKSKTAEQLAAVLLSEDGNYVQSLLLREAACWPSEPASAIPGSGWSACCMCPPGS